MSNSPLTLTAPGSQLCASLLKQGLRVRVRVSGTSMAPLLTQDDVVSLAPVKSEQLRIGDIVFIQDPLRGFYLHRLIRSFTGNTERLFQTRGHGHWRLDDPVSADQILARVTNIEHHQAKPLYWFWLARANPLWARVQFCQSACYYLKLSLTQKLQRLQFF
jgi:hypothetical protein